MKRTSGSYRQSHQGHGWAYQCELDSMPYQQISWMLERRVLQELLEEKKRESEELDYLDFACGTGRITAFVEAFVTRSAGIDVSKSMLEVAQSRVTGTRLVHGDLTCEQHFPQQSMDLITAFRFFGRAEPALRREALQALVPLLKDRGWLILNNHVRCEHYQAPLRRLRRKLLGRDTPHCMSDKEIETVLSESGLGIVKVIPVGVLPPRLRRLVPSELLCRVDRWLAKFWPFARRAQIQMYVCSRTAESL